jgi:proline iminopeptidase
MRPIKALLLAAVSAVVAMGIAYVAYFRPRIRAWGFDPVEAEKTFAGDDLVADPTAVETRGITIDDTPDKVWPWLVQMGYGRAGWYSYEPLDSKLPSAKEILPEFQELNAGDMMPTYPGFSFEVKIVQPEHALVLFTDTALAKTQVDEAQWSAKEKMQEMPDFAASWGFYLEPQADGKTRLIERFRIQAPANAPAPVLNEVLGTGIVLMARKQLIGIKERVERARYGSGPASLAQNETSLSELPVGEVATPSM